MSNAAVVDRCRMTVVGGQRTVELVLPTDLPLMDLLPVLVEHLGTSFADQVSGRGLVAQRLGEAPLDDERTIAALGLRDGDTVYLRPADAALPAFGYDDLLDGVASLIDRRPGRWSPAVTGRVLRALAAFPLGTGLLGLALGVSAPARVAVAGLVALVLLLGVAASARAVGDRAAAAVLAVAAVAYAGFAGLHAVPAATGGGPASSWTCAAATATAAGVLAAIAAGGSRAVLLALGVTGAAASGTGLWCSLTGIAPVRAAGAVTVAMLLLSPVIPSLAFRLSGLRLPDLPTSVEDIRRDVDAVPEQLLTQRTAAADHNVSGLYLAVGAVCAGTLPLLVAEPGWAPPVLALTVCALLALRARMLRSVVQRTALLLPAVLAATLLALRLGLAGSGTPWIAGWLVIVVLAAFGLLAAARVVPARPVRPYWGRTAELLETLLAVALVPLLLQVLGVYGALRGLGG